MRSEQAGESDMLKHLTIVATCSLLAASGASAQQKSAGDFPRETIKIIVCVPAGGGVDTATRIIGERLRQKFNVPVVIENRGGQAGNIGSEAVANAEPDGYTLLAAQPAPLTVNALLYKKLNFDPAVFEPVAVMTTIPNVLLVRGDFPAKTVQEFIAHAKANPGKLNYASQGSGTTSHLTAELLQTRTGTKLTHVPYRGTAPAMNDLIAGHVDLMFVEMAAAMQQHSSGKARILGVATAKRVEALPDVPTFGESGIADFESGTWNAIAAPPKTPPAVTQALNDAVNEVLKMPEVRAQFLSLHMQPMGGTRESMAALIKDEIKRWGDVIRAANVTIN
jgi:tripartite-type tricarboxylate transporter receptor subunit TctC